MDRDAEGLRKHKVDLQRLSLLVLSAAKGHVIACLQAESVKIQRGCCIIGNGAKFPLMSRMVFLSGQDADRRERVLIRKNKCL